MHLRLNTTRRCKKKWKENLIICKIRIRKGNDVAIRWRIFTNGNSEPLEGRQLLLELKSPFGRVFELPFNISEGNVIEAVFRGVDQQNVGFYSLTLLENKGYDGQTAVDAVRAFELVRTTDEENKVGESPDLTTETIDLGTSDITLTGLTVKDLFGSEECFDLTGDEYFAIKVGDELKTISAMTIMQLLGGGSGEGGGGITYIEGDGINIQGRKLSVDTEFVATKEDVNALNEKIDNLDTGGGGNSGSGVSGDIPTGAITTSKIANGAVTTEKLSQAVKDSISNKADKSALENYATKEEVKQMTETTAVIAPNILHVWGEVAELNITLANGEDGVVNEYMVQFASGATATTLTLPDSIVWMSAPNIQANKVYQVSIINNLGVIGEFGHE